MSWFNKTNFLVNSMQIAQDDFINQKNLINDSTSESKLIDLDDQQQIYDDEIFLDVHVLADQLGTILIDQDLNIPPFYIIISGDNVQPRELLNALVQDKTDDIINNRPAVSRLLPAYKKIWKKKYYMYLIKYKKELVKS